MIDVHLEGDECWPDLKDKTEIFETGHIQLATLDKGTTSGLASVSFRIDLPEDSVVLVQVSLREFATAAKMILEKWKDQIDEMFP